TIAGDLTECRRGSERCPHAIGIRVIERVSGLATRLELVTLVEHDVLEQTEIDAFKAWSANHAASRITWKMDACWNILETRRIEPLEARPRSALIWIAHHVRTRAAGAGAEDTQCRRIGSRGCSDGQGQAGIEVSDCRSLPSAEGLAHEALLTPEKRQI